MFHQALIIFPLNYLGWGCFILVELLVNGLNFFDVPLDVFKIYVLELPVLVKASSMLNISKDETGYGLNIKILIILKMEDLV